MNFAPLFFEIILFIWFFGCIVTYKIGKYLLVDGMGIHSAEFLMLVLYGLGIALRLLFPFVGSCYLLCILILWFAIQFFCHWFYTIFGASEQKLKGYNECFRDFVRLFPMSETRLIPDLYHIVLHLLIIINITLLCISMLGS